MSIWAATLVTSGAAIYVPDIRIVMPPGTRNGTASPHVNTATPLL